MLKLKNYNLQSFTLGTKHVRCFSLDNCSGVITDYVLAECGAPSSPLPSEFYKKISSAEGAIKLHNRDDTASYTVTRDNIVITTQTPSITENLDDQEFVIKQANHLIPSTLAFMNNPKAKFLGMVWQFTEKETQARERYKHPVAEELCNKLLKFELNAKEYPAEINSRIVFRKKVPNSYLMHGQDNYLNIIVTIGDSPINDFWADSEESETRGQIVDNTRLGYISLDIQINFDPRRKITDKIIDAHWTECNKLTSRMSELLKGVGIESE